MDPFEILVTATRIGLLLCLGGVLAWAAHQRVAAHRSCRRRLRDRDTDVRMLPYWVTAGSVAGLV